MLFKFHYTFVDKCSSKEHTDIRYKLMLGKGCKSFCQCAPLITHGDGYVEYYWQEQPCPPGTLYSGVYGIDGLCDFPYNVKCADSKP